MNTNPPEVHKQDAMALAIKVSQHFTTIAIGGIAFLTGVSITMPISLWFFWLTLIPLGMSVVMGLVCLMHGVSRLYRNNYNIYENSFRAPMKVQIILVGIGILILCCGLRMDGTTHELPQKTIQINIDGQGIFSYPMEPNMNYTLESSDGKINFIVQPYFTTQ